MSVTCKDLAKIAQAFARTSVMPLPKCGIYCSLRGRLLTWLGRRKCCMPLLPRLHRFQVLVECTANQALSTFANQALSTFCHFVHTVANSAASAAETPPPPLFGDNLGLSGEVTVMSNAAVSLIPQYLQGWFRVHHCLNHILLQGEQIGRDVDMH